MLTMANRKAAHAAASKNALLAKPENSYKVRVQAVYVEARCRVVEGYPCIFKGMTGMLCSGSAKTENEAWRDAWLNLRDAG